jgi:hypothetical protein
VGGLGNRLWPELRNDVNDSLKPFVLTGFFKKAILPCPSLEVGFAGDSGSRFIR